MEYLIDIRDELLIRKADDSLPEVYNEKEQSWSYRDWLLGMYCGEVITIFITEDEANQIIKNEKTINEIKSSYYKKTL